MLFADEKMDLQSKKKELLAELGLVSPSVENGDDAQSGDISIDGCSLGLNGSSPANNSVVYSDNKQNNGHSESNSVSPNANLGTNNSCSTMMDLEQTVNPVEAPLHHCSIFNFVNPPMVLDYKQTFNSSYENFTKGCSWSPDGTCLLVGSEDKKLRLFNLPNQLSTGDITGWKPENEPGCDKPAVEVQEGELLYDYAWFPQMNSRDPSTCCFAVTSRDHPVHLWDAWNGHSICSYRVFDHLDEMVAARSVAFSPSGKDLLCGFRKCIRVFNTSRPGRQCYTICSKEQVGIISCFAFHSKMPTIFAAGSYSGSVGLYNLQKNNLFCLLEGGTSGVTQVRFSPDGTKLFAGHRKNPDIVCWDIRNPGKVLYSLQREVKTNQRVCFDLDSNCLVSGTTNGDVLVWDLNSVPQEDEVTANYSFRAHNDCVNGVSLHPWFPVLATSSGGRHFAEPPDGDEDEQNPLFVHDKKSIENSVKLFWLGEL